MYSYLSPHSILMFGIGCLVTSIGLFSCAMIQTRRESKVMPASEPSEPPPGYVLDPRCYVCAVRIPCIKQQWGWKADVAAAGAKSSSRVLTETPPTPPTPCMVRARVSPDGSPRHQDRVAP